MASISAIGLLILIYPGIRSENYGNAEADFKIAQANLYHGNDDLENAFSELLTVDADLISLQELNSNWIGNVALLKKEYPYFVEKPQNSCCYGIALYSKHPIINHTIISMEGVPVIAAKVDVEGHQVTVFSLHTLPPVFPDQTEERNAQLKAMADLVLRTKGASIVIGDFNIVSWDPVLLKFLSESSLSRVECGFQPTYPMELGIPLIPIDHIAYNEHLQPTECSSFTIPGSDHKGLTACFRLKD